MLIFFNGGLGNQIGNYVFGKYLAFLRGENIKFISSSVKGDRAFVLDNFNVSIENASLEDIEDFLSAKTNPKLLLNLLVNNAPNKKWRNNFWTFLNKVRAQYGLFPQKTPALFSKVVTAKQALTLNGFNLAVGNCYAPVPEFGEETFKNQVKKELTLKTPFSPENLAVAEQIASSKNSVGIHIRRGDYLKLGCSVVKQEFLIEKINFFKENFDSPEFFVFSNDIPWASEALKGRNVNIISLNDEENGFFDFALLNNCRHRIYSISTFSLWLKYLNPYENPIEFFPEPKDLARF